MDVKSRVNSCLRDTNDTVYPSSHARVYSQIHTIVIFCCIQIEQSVLKRKWQSQIPRLFYSADYDAQRKSWRQWNPQKARLRTTSNSDAAGKMDKLDRASRLVQRSERMQIAPAADQGLNRDRHAITCEMGASRQAVVCVRDGTFARDPREKMGDISGCDSTSRLRTAGDRVASTPRIRQKRPSAGPAFVATGARKLPAGATTN